jgi:hypothetical protein
LARGGWAYRLGRQRVQLRVDLSRWFRGRYSSGGLVPDRTWARRHGRDWPGRSVGIRTIRAQLVGGRAVEGQLYQPSGRAAVLPREAFGWKWVWAFQVQLLVEPRTSTARVTWKRYGSCLQPLRGWPLALDAGQRLWVRHSSRWRGGAWGSLGGGPRWDRGPSRCLRQDSRNGLPLSRTLCEAEGLGSESRATAALAGGSGACGCSTGPMAAPMPDEERPPAGLSSMGSGTRTTAEQRGASNEAPYQCRKGGDRSVACRAAERDIQGRVACWRFGRTCLADRCMGNRFKGWSQDRTFTRRAANRLAGQFRGDAQRAAATGARELQAHPSDSATFSEACDPPSPRLARPCR